MTVNLPDEKKMPAIDLSHHLSDLAKARDISPLKAIFKYIENNPNIISMAGGVPNPSYFPFASLSAETLVSSSFSKQSSSSSLSWFWSLLGLSPSKEKTSHIAIPKYPTQKGQINLATALQYGTATGIEPLRKFMNDFTQRVYDPAYSNFTTLVHAGNTDGWSKVAMTFFNEGEGFLTEEWTYPSAISATAPFNIKPIGIKMDADGMRSDDLEFVLANWDETVRGIKRPHVLYTVPCGQNPTGSNMPGERKKLIYDICVKYDILIIEDDPYYFLQEGPYRPPHTRETQTFKARGQDDDTLANNEFIKKLVPSYLKYDYQGRVIRLDTFSKTVAPGSRLGWFTCNPLFAERLEREGETTTQAPCGFSQSLIAQLLTKEWTMDGYIQWLRGLACEYTARRDAMVDLFLEEFHLERETGSGRWEGVDVFVAYGARGKGLDRLYMSEKRKGKPLLSFVTPLAGMFIWFKVHVENLPGLKMRKEGDPESLEERLWVRFAEAGILVGPGYPFASDKGDERLETEAHYRLSFSNAEHTVMKDAVKIMRGVLTGLQWQTWN